MATMAMLSLTMVEKFGQHMVSNALPRDHLP